MKDINFNCLPTIIGSMPHTDTVEAISVVTRYLKEIPCWPQLPNRSYNEDMNVQFSEGFPGITINKGHIFIDQSKGMNEDLERLYIAYLSDKADEYKVSKYYAAGLYQLLSSGWLPQIIKGQITGPVTWGLSINGINNRAVLYDDILGDAIPKFLRLKAKWQENILRKISKNTMIFVDEPYLSSYGSATVPLSGDKIKEMLNEVFKGISGLKGIHCCGNTDWPLVLSTNTDILSFDAYNYAESFSLFPDEVQNFLDRKGIIAWGIVPNSEKDLINETVSSLKDRFFEAISPFLKRGIKINNIIEQSLLTPSCGLAGLTNEMAERSLELLLKLSSTIRASNT